jgi:sorting nexin-1/2
MMNVMQTMPPLNSMTKPHDIECLYNRLQWFEEKVQQVDSLDAQMRRLLASAETLVEQRRELACNTAAFAKAAAMLSNCEEHNSLSRALAQLAEVEEKVESLYADQSNADFAIFCELVKDYVALIGAIKVF